MERRAERLALRRESERRDAARPAPSLSSGSKKGGGKKSGGVGFSDSCKNFDGMTSTGRVQGLDKKFAGLKALHPYHPEVGKMARL